MRAGGREVCTCVCGEMVAEVGWPPALRLALQVQRSAGQAGARGREKEFSTNHESSGTYASDPLVSRRRRPFGGATPRATGRLWKPGSQPRGRPQGMDGVWCGVVGLSWLSQARLRRGEERKGEHKVSADADGYTTRLVSKDRALGHGHATARMGGCWGRAQNR